MSDVESGEHRTRVALRRIDQGLLTGWAELAQQYETQADSWRAWTKSQLDYALILKMALEYNGRYSRRCLEVGCGTGESIPALPEWTGEVVATDLSLGMLTQVSTPDAYRGIVACDVRSLPFHDGCFDLVFGLNPIVSMREVCRVVANGGWILLCYSFGRLTPVYVPPEELIRQLPGSWSAIANESESGTWVSFFQDEPVGNRTTGG